MGGRGTGWGVGVQGGWWGYRVGGRVTGWVVGLQVGG